MNMKTITIADDVYEKLAKIKNNRSFSEVIRDLIGSRGNFDILMIGFGTRSKEEAEELEKQIEDVRKWMESLIRV